MKSQMRTLLFGLIAAVGASTSLHAQATFTARGFTGYGPARGYGLGVGGDVGIQFPFLFGLPAVAGVWGVYHMGTEFFDEDLNAQVEQRIALYGVQGASVWIDKDFFLRGSGQLGAASIRHQVDGSAATTEKKFMLTGGIMIGKRFGDFVVSAEPFFPIVFGSDLTGAAFALYLNVVYVAAP